MPALPDRQNSSRRRDQPLIRVKRRMVKTKFAGAADADEGAGYMLEINGKIFAAEMEVRMMRAVAGLIGHVAGECRPALIIDQRGRPDIPEDIDLRAESAGEAGGNLAHPRLHPLLDFAAMGAQRTFQLDAFRQDIPVLPP